MLPPLPPLLYYPFMAFPRCLKKILLDALLLLAVGSLCGAAWNHRFLRDAWNARNDREALPLPLGLPQVQDLLRGARAVFVDARGEEEFRRGHLPGAVRLPPEAGEEERVALRRRIPTGLPVVVYCSGNGCTDSMKTASLLMRDGVAPVYVYEGGYPEWKAAQAPDRGER
ncbi:MAG TPA: rhodanese-like domain-containing protein [Verrucomicrobiae bacterium]|nr:rhodanese-like domain-containing protein [Verrucomicrobiae bacterium]